MFQLLLLTLSTCLPFATAAPQLASYFPPPHAIDPLQQSLTLHTPNDHSDDAISPALEYNPSGHTAKLTKPSWFTSTLKARRLLALSRTGAVSTIFPESLPPTSHAPFAVAGHSISLREYIADCDEYMLSPSGSLSASSGEERIGAARQGERQDGGNPTFLALFVGTTFKNTAAGSNISLSIDWWDHVQESQPVFPGFPRSEAGLPRVSLLGYLELYDSSRTTREALEQCYLLVHPDAEAWLPKRKGSPHSSYWARMVVTHAYWIGGFGNLQQIGWLNMTEWKGVRRDRSLEGIGDQRGWDDVRLPGEDQA